MSNLLAQILAHKVEEVTRLAAERDLRALRAAVAHAPPTRGFEAALRGRIQTGQAAVIAEMKRASPSQGLLRADFDPASIADGYQRNGAVCVSVLTDEHFFQGSASDLRAVREVCTLPLLRKDFIIDPWQVYETRLMGADCVLLIAAALGDPALQELCELALDLELDVLLEVHNEADLERALATRASVIGINNRDLNSFETSLKTTLALAPKVPAERLAVTESGIHRPQDVEDLRAAGVHAFLVGEALMRAPDPGARLAALFS